MDKTKFRYNEKLLVKLSLILNIIILIFKVGLLVWLVLTSTGIHNRSDSSQSSEGAMYAGAIIAFVMAFIFIGIFIFTLKIIFSVGLIIVGITTKFNKLYSTLSVVSAAYLVISVVGMLLSALKDSKGQISYVYIAYAGVAIFLILNVIIQAFYHTINLKKSEQQRALQENKEESEDIFV